MWTKLISMILGGVFKELLALWTTPEVVVYKEATDVEIQTDEKTILDEHSWILSNSDKL